MKHRIIAILLALLLCLTLLAGCSKTESAATEPAPAQTDAAAASEEAPASAETQPAAAAEPAPEAAPAPDDEAAPAAEPVAEPTPAAEPAPEEALAAEQPEGPAAEPAPETTAYDYTYYPAAEEPDTISMYCPEINMMGPLGELGLDEYSDFDFWPVVEEATNMHLEAIYVPFFSWSENYQLWIAAGEWTDVVRGGTYNGGLEQGVEDDFVLDLTDYVQDLMPNYYHRLLDSGCMDEVTTAGRFLQVCCFSDENVASRGWLIRQDWLDGLGLDAPETWDEYYDVLVGIRDAYHPETPLYFTKSCAVENFGGFDVPYYSVGETSLAYFQKDGIVSSGLVTEEYRNYLRWMNRCYQEGLISRDFMSVEYDPNAQKYTADWTGGQLAVWYGGARGYADLLNYDVEEGFAMSPVIGPVDYHGQLNANQKISVVDDGTMLVTVAASDHVENVLNWIDYWYSDPGILVFNYGVEGLDYTLDENGQPQYTDSILHNVFDLAPSQYLRCRCPNGFMIGYTLSHRTDFEYTDEQLSALSVWDSVVDGSHVIPGNLSMDSELNSEQNILTSDLCTLSDEWIAKFIIGDRDLETEWDTYQELLRNNGIDRCVEIEQIALDAYNAN